MDNVEIVVILKSPVSTTAFVTPYLSIKSNISTFVALLRPLFSVAEEDRLTSATTEELRTLSEMRRFLIGHAPSDIAQEVVNEIGGDPLVESIYIKPPTENPLAPYKSDQQSKFTEAEHIPEFSPQQGYLDHAPNGVDAKFAWSLDGGQGTDIRIIDIEGGWQLSHIDLRQKNGGLVGGTPYPYVDWRNHGTAVLAQIGGDKNSFGVTGISPDATLSAISHRSIGSAKAIQLAAQRLQNGDVILLEMHRPGPRYDYQQRLDQKGYICVEWWPDDLLAIQYATLKGIIVVEAAGNGGENLDEPLFNNPGLGFPANWKNPFTDFNISGAIVVGAGAPPSGLYGQDRSRLEFSNYGNRVDCQGWGRGVVTAGYGDLFKCSGALQDEDYWYTEQFSGTSSASPIVTGVIACLQGIAKQRGTILTHFRLRNALRTSGSTQLPDNSERIGSRPDLRQLIEILKLNSS